MDGSNLATLLVGMGYRVVGIVRRNSIPENQTSRLLPILDKIETIYGDVTDPQRIAEIVRTVQPDEVYHLAAQSHVRVSWEMPQFTVQTNAVGTLNVLEAIRQHCPKARSYTACSSEQFGLGVDDDLYQRETTRFEPTSPYGCSKVFAYNITKHYRKAFGMFATCGILFNHSGKHRGAAFVEAKVAKTLAEIVAGKLSKLRLGNMTPQRDIGYSPDYVRAMWMMLQHSEPDDFVVATGETRSVREITQKLCDWFGLDFDAVVETDVEHHKRPQELPYLRGDSSKVRRVLGWAPTVTLDQILDEMATHWREQVRG
jgi:GDPmannose 4,6-dehydratase